MFKCGDPRPDSGASTYLARYSLCWACDLKVSAFCRIIESNKGQGDHTASWAIDTNISRVNFDPWEQEGISITTCRVIYRNFNLSLSLVEETVDERRSRNLNIQ